MSPCRTCDLAGHRNSYGAAARIWDRQQYSGSRSTAMLKQSNFQIC